MTNQIKNVIQIKIDDETLHKIAQQKLNRNLREDELNFAKDGLDEDVSKEINARIGFYVRNAIETMLVRRSKDVVNELPRYEVYSNQFDYDSKDFELVRERSFRTEQDALEYAAISPLAKIAKIVKVEQTEIAQRLPEVKKDEGGEQLTPF